MGSHAYLVESVLGIVVRRHPVLRGARELHVPLGPPKAGRCRDRRARSEVQEPSAQDRTALARRARIPLGDGTVDGHPPLPRFPPRGGIRFAWVTWHWIAGLVLAASILFHIIHASFWL